jgi:hypothetical protein
VRWLEGLRDLKGLAKVLVWIERLISGNLVDAVTDRPRVGFDLILTMAQLTINATGRYFWELVFSLDNSGNSGSITRSTKIRSERKTSFKELLTNKFNIQTAYTLNSKSSVSLKFDGLGDGSGSTDQSLHLEVANDIVRSTETGVETNEVAEFEEVFNIAGGGKLEVYRLCYATDGGIRKSDIIATQPKDDIFVNLRFTAQTRILGLNEILDRFLNTFPGSSNVVEWQNIRNGIVSISDRSSEEKFRGFVEILSGVTPGHENTVEWANIRQTCSEILADYDSKDKQDLFKKLLTRFLVTVPGSSNTVEWARIRDVSSNVLNSTSQIF